MTDNKLKTRIVLEMMGRPKEHLVETLQKLIEALAKEKGLVISEKNVHEPRKLEEQNKESKVEITEDQQLYTTFAEIDLEVDDIITLLGIVFRYMPSHIEIVSPENINLDNFNLNIIINELATRLHYYDSVAKSAIMNNNLLASKMQEIIKKTGYVETKAEEANLEKPIEEKKEEPVKEKKKSKKKSED